MAEENQTAAPDAGSEEPKSVQVALQKLYLKDASFECPKGHKAFSGQWAPKINLDLNLTQSVVDEKHIETLLSLTVTATNDEETAFLVEVHQAGIFLADGLNDQQKQQIANTFCPNTLFPYAREAVDGLVSRGGFPPLMLAPINFDALYQQQLAKAQAEQEAQAGESN